MGRCISLMPRREDNDSARAAPGAKAFTHADLVVIRAFAGMTKLQDIELNGSLVRIATSGSCSLKMKGGCGAMALAQRTTFQTGKF